MPQIQLKYGRTSIPFDYDEDRFEVLRGSADPPPLTDVEIGRKLDHAIGSLPLEERINPDESVLLVVPDATRQTGSGQIVNLLVRRLIAAGVAPFDITIIFATGIHRQVTNAEKESILTPFIVQRIKTIDHGPRDLMQIVNVGETSGGIPVQLNRALVEHDHVILGGGIGFHYFAGFTGGRKLICPGLASSKTISATHKLAFDCETLDRRAGVGTGLLDGNAVHEAFVEAASKIESVFCISTHVNDAGEVTDLFCGDLDTSHRAACDAYAAAHTIEIAEKRDVVIVSCGGLPHDMNMIQAHKALDAAANACNDGGTIILLAECADGLGRADFLDWFNAADSHKLAEKLCQKYQVNGQTAWSLLRKAENFKISVMASLPSETLAAMRLTKIDGQNQIAARIAKTSHGYFITNGAKFMIA
ncbi:MAG: nickel-dependent lactate racemase [Acidobacteriota bacterium]